MKRVLWMVLAACLSGCLQMQPTRRGAEPEEAITTLPAPDHSPAPKTNAVVPVPAPVTTVTNVAPATVSRPVEKPTPLPVIDLEAERQALLRADIEFSEASRAKGSAAAFYQFLVSEAIFLQSGEPPVRGSETIRVRMAAGPQGILTWTPMDADVSLKGDMGYTWGSYEFRGKNGDRRVSYGKYVNVWKKQQDKSWKVVLASQTASPDLPLRRSEPGNPP